MSPQQQEMQRIIDCWELAEKRAKHLCAYETLGLNCRCRKPNQDEVKKAWHKLCARLHPDRHVDCSELATEATRCINLAKQHLFEVHFGGGAARVAYKHEPDKEEAQAREEKAEAAAKEKAEATEVAALAAQQARLAAEAPPEDEEDPWAAWDREASSKRELEDSSDEHELEAKAPRLETRGLETRNE